MAQPCPYPALHRPLNLHSSSVFQLRDSVQVGQASGCKPTNTTQGGGIGFPRARNAVGNQPCYSSRGLEIVTFLHCMNGGFVQPSPACLREVRAACWLCHGSEPQPGALQLSPQQVNKLQGEWACIASKKLSRVPVSHPEAF